MPIINGRYVPDSAEATNSEVRYSKEGLLSRKGKPLELSERTYSKEELLSRDGKPLKWSDIPDRSRRFLQVANTDQWRFFISYHGDLSGLELFETAMDRLAIVAKDLSDLAAETAIDLALIEAKRGQIDRAQAENWALLRELAGQAK